MLPPEPKLHETLQRYLDGEIEAEEAAPLLLGCDLGDSSGFGLEDVSAEQLPRVMKLFATMGTIVQQRRDENPESPT